MQRPVSPRFEHSTHMRLSSSSRSRNVSRSAKASTSTPAPNEHPILIVVPIILFAAPVGARRIGQL